MSRYSVSLEVAGPLAMFTRPDTGGTPTSYPVLTWSAAKAIFESIAMLRSGDAWIRPTRVEVCKRKGAVFWSATGPPPSWTARRIAKALSRAAPSDHVG
jgi:CRISPR-associated Cas5-like protein